MPWMSTSCCFRRSSLLRLELPSWLTRETFELRDTYTQFQDSFGVSYGASALGAATLNITDRFPFPCTMSGRSLVRGWKELLFVYSAFTAPASENTARPSSKLTTCLPFGGTCTWQAEGALIVGTWEALQVHQNFLCRMLPDSHSPTPLYTDVESDSST